MTEGIVATGVCMDRGDERVLEGVDFTAAVGGVTAILGPNGAGKSSLLKAIAGILPYSGSIRINGADVGRLLPSERASIVAYVPQQSSLRSPLPVREVVALGRYARERAGESSGDREQAVEAALRRMDALVLAERPFTQLSGGEQRRVLLARALAGGADTLLLDEPAASLDVAHALALFRTCRELANEGKTIVMVLHQLADTPQFSDHVLLLHRGRAVAQGPARDVVVAARVREIYEVTMLPNAAPSFELSTHNGG